MQIVEKRTLMTSGKNNCKVYRIPGIIVTAKGTILAYCEGRDGPDDWTCSSIILRRSEDGGQSWSDEQRIVQCMDGNRENHPLNNPVMIADRDGSIHFLWQEAYHRAFYQRSTDDGRTFSEPVEFTPLFDEYRTRDGLDWNVFAFGPGHGTQLSTGRLVVPTWLGYGKGRAHAPSVLSVIVSDDGGRSWQTGEILEQSSPEVNMNETCMSELSDGKVLFNIRNHDSGGYRAISVSTNGKNGFSAYRLDTRLPDPRCYAGMAAGMVEGKRSIVFSNCAVHPTKKNSYCRMRMNLTVRLSDDDCQSWKYSRMLELRSGYSDIAISDDGQWIYCFYEQDVEDYFTTEPRHLTFARFNPEWLKN